MSKFKLSAAKDLRVAAINGDKGACERAVIVEEQPVDTRFECGRPALMLAAKEGHLELCLKLVELGASVNLTDVDNRTALSHAAGNGRTQVCAKLLELGTDANIASIDGRTAPNWAARNGYLEVCLMLVEFGADPNKASQDGWTMLMYAVKGGQVEAARRLVELGADPNFADENGDTVLHRACRWNKLEIAKWLAEQMSSEAVLGLNRDGKSALQVWGAQFDWKRMDWRQDEVADPEKDAFGLHIDALFSDVL